jgi:hypothetical protein
MTKNKISPMNHDRVQGSAQSASQKGEIISVLAIASIVAITAGLSILSSVIVKQRQTTQTKAQSVDTRPNCTFCATDGSCQLNTEYFDKDLQYLEAGGYHICKDGGCYNDADCSQAPKRRCTSNDYTGCDYCGADSNFMGKNENSLGCKDWCKDRPDDENCAKVNALFIPKTLPLPESRSCAFYDNDPNNCQSHGCRFVSSYWSFGSYIGCNKCVEGNDTRDENQICDKTKNQLYCKGPNEDGNDWINCDKCGSSNPVDKLADDSGCVNYCQDLKSQHPNTYKTIAPGCDNIINSIPQSAPSTAPVTYNDNFCGGNYATSIGGGKTTWSNCNLCGQAGVKFDDDSHCFDFCQDLKNKFDGTGYTAPDPYAYTAGPNCVNYLINKQLSVTPEAKSSYYCLEPGNSCRYLSIGSDDYTKYTSSDDQTTCDYICKAKVNYYYCPAKGSDCAEYTVDKAAPPRGSYGRKMIECNTDCKNGTVGDLAPQTVNKYNNITTFKYNLICSDANKKDCGQCGTISSDWSDISYCAQWKCDRQKVAFPNNVPSCPKAIPTLKPQPKPIVPPGYNLAYTVFNKTKITTLALSTKASDTETITYISNRSKFNLICQSNCDSSVKSCVTTLYQGFDNYYFLVCND